MKMLHRTNDAVPAGLQAAQARADKLLEERRRIREAIRAAEVGVSQSLQEVRAAELGYGAEEAQVALDPDAQANISGARKKLAAARGTLEAAESRLAGLKGHLQVQAEGINAAHRDLELEVAAWTATRLAAHEERVMRAAGELAGILREGVALAFGSGVNEYAGWLRLAQFPKRSDFYVNLLSTELNLGGDSDMRLIYESAAQLRSTLAALKEETISGGVNSAAPAAA